MALGDKLQDIAQKLFTKFGTQAGTFRITKEARAAATGGKIAAPYASNTLTNVDIATGIQVLTVNSYRASGNNTLKIGDLVARIPGDLVTAAQLEGSSVIYPYTGASTDPRYNINSFRHENVVNGVTTVWEVICRKG